METNKRIVNFGRNVDFHSAHYYEPSSEEELLEILNRHNTGKIRVVASKHAWSGAIVSADVIVNMRNFNEVKVDDSSEPPLAIVGGGTQMKKVLAELAKRGLTTPSIGLITEQTIAGAISTGTHGSGKNSLSHYMESLRIACFDNDGKAEIREVKSGESLQAARCSLGCLGIILGVTFRCVPQYWVTEKATWCTMIDDALVLEDQSPLQQFFLLPHSWRYVSQERRVSDLPQPSWSAWLYRWYWFLSLDIGLHLGVIASARWLRSRSLVHALFRWGLPASVFSRWVVTDRSDRILVMEHELFRHLEIELFVAQSKVREAAAFVAQVLQLADGQRDCLAALWQDRLGEMGMSEELQALRGIYCHHYPICFRRILADDTLISMSEGTEPWVYSISLITYVEPREPFFQVGRFLARSMAKLFGARPHWGKWFPLSGGEVEELYPRLEAFRETAYEFDRSGVFRNPYVEEVFSFPTMTTHQEANGRQTGSESGV
ncbi:oxidoreductase [Blastopirellula marina]|uniref:Oxidoreductase n=1 Tax=Blastopirellula marina TaxID=124 RepID=A0A2S8F5B0_9BACT|nr:MULTISPECIES: D-arabinono-1,4-lactone oxidase [Pirellulaceae]PQO27353.1 oxidoreductase [Blastopirellula marina]RCS47890.1 FAD-binding protein [Bremerella cremea]